VSFTDPKASERWELEKCSRRGLAELGGEGYSYLLLLGEPCSDWSTKGFFEIDEPRERRYELVSTELPVCWGWTCTVGCALTWTVGCAFATSAAPGGVIGSWGPKVDRKCVFRPVSSLGSGSIRGSIMAWCA
jgi:hypothetical protein